MPDEEKGINIGCSTCHVAHLPDPDFVEKAFKSTAEIYGHMARIGIAEGWSSSVENGEARFVCPGCIAKAKDAIDKPLPRYNRRAKCPKCGAKRPTTTFCDGKRPDCGLGAVRDHQHRECATCGFAWIEGCLT